MRKRSLPLVLAALNPATETYIVAGIWSTLNRSEGADVGTVTSCTEYYPCIYLQSQHIVIYEILAITFENSCRAVNGENTMGHAVVPCHTVPSMPVRVVAS